MARISAKKRVLVVLAGNSLPAKVLAGWVASCDFIAAADGGAEALLAIGVFPDLVVGDMDSLQNALPPSVQVVQADDPNLTDCDKVLAHLKTEGVEAVTMANLEGGLPDHQLAVYHSAAKSGIHCRLIFERGFGYVLAGKSETRVAAEGRVSLLPLTVCQDVDFTGVQWPLTGATLDPMGQTSISNQAEGGCVEVKIGLGAALLFVERPIASDWTE